MPVQACLVPRRSPCLAESSLLDGDLAGPILKDKSHAYELKTLPGLPLGPMEHAVELDCSPADLTVIRLGRTPCPHIRERACVDSYLDHSGKAHSGPFSSLGIEREKEKAPPGKGMGTHVVSAPKGLRRKWGTELRKRHGPAQGRQASKASSRTESD